MSARELITLILLAAGTGLEAFACLGVLLMRDPLDRLHYLAPSSLAGLLLAAAILVRDSWSLVGDKALLIAVFLLVSSPVLVHVTAGAIAVARGEDRR